MSNWLPSHQSHMLYTIAHADGLIERMGDALYSYLQVGPFELEARILGGREEVVVRSLSPMPEAVPRLASDALNQLRSAMEHALYVLGRRIEVLQPYQGEDSQTHPLKVLAEHTNLSKHRMPAVAAVRLGTIVLKFPFPGLVISGDDTALEVGDVLASLPAGRHIPMDIWPKIGIRRPHTGAWMILVQELLELEAWVRTEALPLIIMGTKELGLCCQDALTGCRRRDRLTSWRDTAAG